jgi:hypothetical protein
MDDPQYSITIAETRLRCSICHDFLCQPITLTCSHTFCRTCLSHWVSTQEQNRVSATCPTCRASLSSHMTASSIASAVPDRLMSEILHKTCYVDCPNGCSCKLHPSRLSEHDEMCANITVPCANAVQGCPVTMPRKALADHAAMCSFHMCSGAALGCTRHDDRGGIAAHELSCPLVRIRQYIDSRLRNNSHKAPGGPISRDRQLWGPMHGSRLDSLSSAGVVRLGPLHIDNLNSMASSLNTLLDSG